MSVDLSEFISGFLAEAEDHLRSINAHLLQVERTNQAREPNPRAIRELFRSLHTMKGLAGMVGVEPIVEIAHAMERVLRDADQDGGRLPARAFEPLLQGTKAITVRVNALATGEQVSKAPPDLLEALDSIDSEETDATSVGLALEIDPVIFAKLNSSEREQLTHVAGNARAFQLAFSPSTERATRGVTITTIRERLARISEIVKVVPSTVKESGALSFVFLITSSASARDLASLAECSPEEVIPLSPQNPAPLHFEEPAELDSASAVGMLRVDVRRVDRAMDGLGELLITKFRLARAVAQLAERGADVRELLELTQETHRGIREVRNLVLGLRMIALSELFDRLPILVRGLQTSTGKAVDLVMEVGSVEVDKTVGERLWPVLIHLIRNAVDHGLEPGPERVRRGKPEKGVIRVRCDKSSSSRLELTISDDGAGVDAERVAQRARHPTPEDDAALLDLIARPGLSTREAATSTSGRGMGLDIARRIVVNELGGDLRLQTVPGQGTSFTLEVPITVAVVDTFRFQCALQLFLVPVASVEEFVDVDPADLVLGPVLGPQSRAVALFSRRGRTMPFIELSSLFGQRRTGRSGKAIVVRRSDQLFAFGVERLIDHHEVIVRRLSDPLVDVPGVVGAADLGDGRPTLLLDLVALTRLSGESERAA